MAEQNALIHADYRWVSAGQLAEYDFAPADIPFVQKLQNKIFKIN